MQTEKELNFTATRFLEVAESCLEKGKEDFGADLSMTLPMSQKDFDRTLEALDLIQELGKERNIHVELEDESTALQEYGHTRCFKFEKIK